MYLLRYLSKVVDKANSGIFLERIIYAKDVNISLVEQMMKDVDRFHSRGTILSVPKDQIDPFM